jgi:hypothetical protein
MKYRNHLPQLDRGLFLTDGGIETMPCNWRRRSIVIAQSMGPASAVVSAFICLHRKTVGVASAERRPSISRAMIRFHSSGNLQSEGRTRVG